MDIDFQDVFRGNHRPALITRAQAEFPVVDASDAYVRAALTERAAIVGRSLYDVFPYNLQASNARTCEAARAVGRLRELM